MREIDVLRMLFRQTSSSNNNNNNNKNDAEEEKRKQQQELLQTLRRETEEMKSLVRSIETDVSSSRTRTLILQDEMEKINVRKIEAEKRSQKRLEGIRTETKLAELTLSTLPTSTSTNTHSYREIQDDVDDIVQLVNLHERIKKDSENVFQRHELNTVRNFFSNHESEITHNNKSDF